MSRKKRASPIKAPVTKRMETEATRIVFRARMYVSFMRGVERGETHRYYTEGAQRYKKMLWEAVENYESARWASIEREKARLQEKAWFDKLAAHAP